MTTPAIDAGELIDRGHWTLYQKLLTLLVAAAVSLDGFDIQILAFAVPSLSKSWGVDRSAFAPVMALGLIGMALGGPVFGYIGDRFGRRPALIGAVALFAAATLATASAGSIPVLAILRLITGFGAGGALPGASALASEFAPAGRRAVAVKLTIVCVPLGGVFGGAIAAVVLPSFGWRALYIVGGAAPLCLSLLLAKLLPESPRFLALHGGDWPKLSEFLNRAGHSIPPGAEFAVPASEASGSRASLADLLSPALARSTAGLGVAFFSSLAAVYLVFGWLPTMLSSEGMNVAQASSGLAVYNLGGVIGVLIWAVLTPLFGSRGPLLWGALGAAASALLVLPVPVHAGLIVMAALGLHGLLANATQTSLYALAAHVYPTRVRALGVACAATLGRSGGIVSSLYGSAMIGLGGRAYFGALAAAMLVASAGVVIVNRHIPPDAGRKQQ